MTGIDHAHVNFARARVLIKARVAWMGVAGWLDSTRRLVAGWREKEM